MQLENIEKIEENLENEDEHIINMWTPLDIEINEDYNYIKEGIMFKIASTLLYIIVWPILVVYNKIMYNFKIYGRKNLTKIKTGKIDENKYAFVPILRAGMGMTEGIENLIPNAKIGVVGLYRNEETLKPVKYYYKVPKDIANRTVILLDPMLATGGSAIDAISMLKEDGVKNIKFLCIIAAPEGIKKLEETYPDVEVYCAKIDEKLNENGYILPGLGDAGDRIFGTK